MGRARRPLRRQLLPGPDRRPGAPGPRPALDPGQRPAVRRPAAAPRGVHLRQRHDPARLDAGAARRAHHQPRACRSPRWTTRSGSTGRSGPTSGGSTTRRVPRPRGGRGPRARPGLHPGRRPRGHRRPGRPDPAPWLTPAPAGPARPPRPRGPRRRPLPRPPARHRAAARLRRAGGRAGADRRRPHRRPGRTSRTRCTPTSCCPATRRCRSSTTSSGIRDGRSFATRRVVARQHGRPIYYHDRSFQRAEEGFDHQDVDARGARPRPGPRPRRPDARPGNAERRRARPRSGPRSRSATSATRGAA